MPISPATRPSFAMSLRHCECSAARITLSQIYENTYDWGSWGGETDYEIFDDVDATAQTAAFNPIKLVGYKADGSIVSSGTDMTDITEIIGVFQAGYGIYSPDAYYGGATPQAVLNSAIADMAQLQNWRGTLTYSGTNVETTVNFAAVPEPATMSLLGLGALALIRRKRRAN